MCKEADSTGELYGYFLEVEWFLIFRDPTYNFASGPANSLDDPVTR